MKPSQSVALIELLWEYLTPVSGDKDKRLTGWGKKTKVGLVASIEAILSEK